MECIPNCVKGSQYVHILCLDGNLVGPKTFRLYLYRVKV